MREIEIKAEVKDRESLLAAIKKRGITLSDPLKQHDVVYIRSGVAAGTLGSIGLRIRTENDTKKIFTLKKLQAGGLDKIEHETEIANAQELEAIIKLLGFELYSDLTKCRQKAAFDGIEICVDDVENLGVFIEAEKLIENDGDDSRVVDDLWAVMESFGVSRADEVFDGYDVLMNKKLGSK